MATTMHQNVFQNMWLLSDVRTLTVTALTSKNYFKKHEFTLQIAGKQQTVNKSYKRPNI